MLEPAVGGSCLPLQPFADHKHLRALVHAHARDLWRWVLRQARAGCSQRVLEREAASLIKSAIRDGREFGAARAQASALSAAGPGCKDLDHLRGVQRLQEAEL